MTTWTAVENRIDNLINENLETLTDSEVTELCRLKKLASKKVGDQPNVIYKQALELTDTAHLYNVERVKGKETIKKAIPLDAVVRFLRDRKEECYLIKRQGKVVSTGTEFIRHR